MSVSRRGLMMGAGLAGVAAASPTLAAQALQGPGLEVLDLKAASVVAPIGVEDQAVRLSWRLVSPDPDVKQTRYEVQAASTREKLAGLGQEIPPAEQLTPQALGSFQKAEIEKWWPIVKAAGIKAE